MGIVSGGGGSGNTTAQVVASGKVLPVADATGVTVDTTTYNDTISGVGKLTTLVASAGQGALAFALLGDAFPRVVWDFDPRNDGLSLSDGTFDATGPGPQLTVASGSRMKLASGSPTTPVLITTPIGVNNAAGISQVSPQIAITSGALPTVQLVSATGAQIVTTRDVETVTPCTFNPGAATTATVTVALSPDNLTYSTLGVVTEPAGVALDGTILLVSVCVPAGWYLKLTVNAQAVLGLTTYY